MTIETLTGVRYVVPLREGGSLPAVVDTDRDGPYVVKFRGAGQGVKVLVAEVIAFGIARALGLPVPDVALVVLREGFGKGEPDPEIQDLLQASSGVNFGMRYLPAALSYDPSIDADAARDLADAVVWLDAFISNVDRTPRNTNMLLCREQLWLIDHGASLYFHHQWQGWEVRVQSPFPQIKDHVLLPLATNLAGADARLRPLLTDDELARIVDTVPDDWLGGEALFTTVAEHRHAYVTYLSERLHGPRRWLQEAIDAHERGPVRHQTRLTHRVV